MDKKIKKRVFVFIFLIILMSGIFTYSFFFYSSEEGLKSVYIASFDWKIDLLATFSGLYVLFISTYLFLDKKIKIIPFSILSVIGASQSMMHVAKWIVRHYFVIG